TLLAQLRAFARSRRRTFDTGPVVAARIEAADMPLAEWRIRVIHGGADRERVAARPVMHEARVEAGEAELLVLQGRVGRRGAAILRARGEVLVAAPQLRDQLGVRVELALVGQREHVAFGPQVV